MNSLDVATYISEQCSGNMPMAISFIENELGIGLKTSIHPNSGYGILFYDVFINQQQVIKGCGIGSAQNSILEMWKYFTDEQREKLIQSIQTSINYNNNINVNQNTANSQANNKTDINVSPVFNVSANASNETIINISTLNQLSSQVEQNTNIENKQEIKNLISQLKVAEDDNDEEGYFDLFFKLTEKLENTGLIPVWLAKSAKFAKKFIDK